MSLFKPAKNESAFLKLGLMGGTGSGKTFTACLVACGLVQLARERGLDYANKPVLFIDSENGSDYVADVFAEAGIELMVAKTKSFGDLCTAVKEAEREASFLVIDSVSAFWEEWKSTYQKQKGRSRLQFEDFAAIKTKWREGFTDRFINSKLHIAMCGRLAYEYDYSVDEETGKKNLEKTDVKMAAEKELGYETSLFVMMERDNDLRTMQQVRTATVLKDRFRILDGKQFTNPTFATFAPHILKLNLGGTHAGVDLARTSADLVPADPRRENTGVRRRIVVDELDALLAEHGAGGTSNDAKAKRAALVREHFRTVSKTEIEELMPLVDLQAGFDSLHRALTGQPSRYGVPDAPAPTDDEIPFTDAAPPPAAPVPAPPVTAAAQAEPPHPGAVLVEPDRPTLTAAEEAILAEAPDPRDVIVESICCALAKAGNKTQLAAVVKANLKHRKALDEERNAKLDAAMLAAKSRLDKAALPALAAG